MPPYKLLNARKCMTISLSKKHNAGALGEALLARQGFLFKIYHEISIDKEYFLHELSGTNMPATLLLRTIS
jgi:hypothetical protein